MLAMVLIHVLLIDGGHSIHRSDLTINNCRASGILIDPIKEPIFINKHCNDKIVAYSVSGGGKQDVNGLYELYGRSIGAPRYEYTRDDGSVTSLGRYELQDGSYVWALFSDGDVLYAAPDQGSSPPTDNSWIATRDDLLPVPTLRKHIFKRKSIKKKIIKLNRSVDSKKANRTTDEENLLALLHPAVGYDLGKQLSRYYNTASPVPAITIDNLFNKKKLRKALTFSNVSLSNWIGPEESPHCCKGKYRLNFTKWPPRNKYVLALHHMLSSRSFIRFLEGLTSINGLIPMTVDKESVLWAGSSLIAIAPGGYLYLHNDVRNMNVYF